MNTQKIPQREISDASISALPNHPCAGKEYGGAGLSAQQMKAAFDSLPMLAINTLNSLINDIESEGDGKIGESIKTGLRSGHTLYDFFRELENGTLASYFTVGDSTLIDKILALSDAIEEIKSRLDAIDAKL